MPRNILKAITKLFRRNRSRSSEDNVPERPHTADEIVDFLSCGKSKSAGSRATALSSNPTTVCTHIDDDDDDSNYYCLDEASPKPSNTTLDQNAIENYGIHLFPGFEFVPTVVGRRHSFDCLTISARPVLCGDDDVVEERGRPVLRDARRKVVRNDARRKVAVVSRAGVSVDLADLAGSSSCVGGGGDGAQTEPKEPKEPKVVCVRPVQMVGSKAVIGHVGDDGSAEDLGGEVGLGAEGKGNGGFEFGFVRKGDDERACVGDVGVAER